MTSTTILHSNFVKGILFGASLSTFMYLVYLSTTEENIKVVILPQGYDETMVEQLQPKRLSKQALLRNLLAGLGQLQGEVQKQQGDLKAETQSMQGRLHEQVQEMQGKVDLHSDALNEQLTLLEKTATALKESEAMVLAKEAYLLETQLDRGEFKSTNPDSKLWITDDSMQLWQQRKFRPYSAYGFVKWSAYRVSRSRIVVLGLAARSGHKGRQLEWCEWHPEDGGDVIKGDLKLTYGEEHHFQMYENIILVCDLKEDVKSSGGHLKAAIDHEIMYLYKESADTKVDRGQGPFQYELAFCGPPMHTEINARLVKEWLEYHHFYLGIDHFAFYDVGALTPAVVDAIEAFLAAGVVSVTEMREAYNFDTWYYAQGLIMNDCSYRMRELAKWVMIHDLDEFVELVPRQPLKQFLHQYEDKAWLTHGCVAFSDAKCVPGHEAMKEENSFLVSSLQYRWPHYYCMKNNTEGNMCLDQYGHRKLIINPRKALKLQIHVVAEFEGEGVDLSADTIRHMHYSGLGKVRSKVCTEPPPEDGWWTTYSGIANISHVIVRCRKKQKPRVCILKRLGIASASEVGELQPQEAKEAVRDGSSKGGDDVGQDKGRKEDGAQQQDQQEQQVPQQEEQVQQRQKEQQDQQQDQQQPEQQQQEQQQGEEQQQQQQQQQQ